ncbi:hypothetical protein [Tenacibaculum sp. A30]|uniref:hypothetical protein n=1 Tax=Tenacibaculum sp. A30 TaxID=3442644 RepID=UPI003EBA2050
MRYQLNKKDYETIIEYSSFIIQNTKNIAFNCANISALIKAVITDNHNIPAKMIAGHFNYQGKRLFNCTSNIPFDYSKKVLNEIWDGHCWVQIEDYILDLTITKSSKISFPQLKKEHILFESIENLRNNEIIYTPVFTIEDKVIDGLIKGFNFQ